MGRKRSLRAVIGPNEQEQDQLSNACADGGGIRGYVTLLVLKSLMQAVADVERFENQALRHQENIAHYASNDDPLTYLLPLPYYYFDYIVGTSTGG